MKKILGNMEAILDTQVSGFHQYSLQEPVHLTFVSQNLCNMTGYRQEELINEYRDLYAPLVHPADRDEYRSFLTQLAQKEQSLTIQYRIISKDGTVKYVSDTATSGRTEDGTIVASSVLSDITEMKEEQDSLQFLNETVPCGFLKYTCDKHPKVTYFNEQMLEILGFSDDPEERQDFLEMYKENIYLMIPMEQRRKFSVFLKRVYSQDSTIAGELMVQKCDGTKIRLYGWVSKCINEQGQEEFQTVCMDMTEKYEATKARETERYMKALTEVYDRIFEYDFANKTVKCLYGRDSATFSRMLNIPMHLQEGTDHYINNVVIEEDRAVVQEYFHTLYQPEETGAAERPPQINFRALSSSGEIKEYNGIFIRMDSTTGLFCCRDAYASPAASTLRAQGTVAFEIDGDKVKPLYASDNICRFFGYSREEWDQLSQKTHSIKEFISRSGVPYSEFSKLLQQGEAEFDYTDIKSGVVQRIKAVCSHMFANGASAKYIMLYNVDPAAAQSAEASQPRINIRTFGYFDVFVDDNPIAFRNKKSKELLALLVDRRGGFVTSEEAISYLWEDEPVNAVTLARYRKVAMRLKNILEEYGIADMVEAVDGKRRVVAEKIQCDLYDYLSQKEEFAHLFKGSYLTNYSWGENTLGELVSEQM